MPNRRNHGCNLIRYNFPNRLATAIEGGSQFGMPNLIPSQAFAAATIVESLFQAAKFAAQQTAKLAAQQAPRPQNSAGKTRRPGEHTPLWTELVELARPHLAKRGEKAKLARLMGLPRQRIQDFLKAGSAMPDAERTLFLFCWVMAKQDGRNLTA
jgi:hypothetical protein